MKKLLIVRSASFQQLDKNLPSIRAAFPDHELHLLTHEHGRKLAEKYAEVKRVLVYPHAGPFRKGRGIPDLEGQRYDDVAVLAANLSGAGFANVLLFAAGLGMGELHLVNLVGETRSVLLSDIKRLWWRDVLCKISGATLGILLGLAAAAALLFALPFAIFSRTKEL